MEIFRSAALFFLGVLRRFYIWLPPVLLDPFDVNKKVVQPMLPDNLRFELPWSPDWAPFVLFGLLIWAAVLTYHEVREKHLVSSSKPDMPAKKAYRYLVMDSKWALGRDLGHDDCKLAFDAEGALRDAASIGKIHVWGRTSQRLGPEFSETLQEIPREYWREARLDLWSLVSSDHKIALSSKSGTSSTEIYDDVRFSEEEIKQAWPPAGILKRATDRKRYLRKELMGTRL